MSQKSMGLNEGADATVRDIRRRTRKQYSAEETIRIVLASLRGEESIAELCRRLFQPGDVVAVQPVPALRRPSRATKSVARHYSVLGFSSWLYQEGDPTPNRCLLVDQVADCVVVQRVREA